MLGGRCPGLRDAGDAGVEVLGIDDRYRAAVQHGQVTRLDVSPLPRWLAERLEVADRHEVVVPTPKVPVVAPTPPRRASWGKRLNRHGAQTDAACLATAIGDDVASLRGLVIGGRDAEDRALERDDGSVDRTAVQGRNAASSNRWAKGTDLLLYHRLQRPIEEVAVEVWSLLADAGASDDQLPVLDRHGKPAMGRTPLGASLPLDGRIRASWLTERSAHLRNAVGRARGVRREPHDADVLALVLDQDAVRWPALMLPGHAVRTCAVGELFGAVLREHGIPLERFRAVEGELRQRFAGAERAAAKVEREAQVLELAAAGASTQEIAAALGVAGRTVQRARSDRPPLEVLLRGGLSDLARSLAELPPAGVSALAEAESVTAATVRKWRAAAARLVAGEDLDRRTLDALERACRGLAALTAAEPPSAPVEAPAPAAASVEPAGELVAVGLEPVDAFLERTELQELLDAALTAALAAVPAELRGIAALREACRDPEIRRMSSRLGAPAMDRIEAQLAAAG